MLALSPKPRSSPRTRVTGEVRAVLLPAKRRMPSPDLRMGAEPLTAPLRRRKPEPPWTLVPPRSTRKAIGAVPPSVVAPETARL